MKKIIMMLTFVYLMGCQSNKVINESTNPILEEDILIYQENISDEDSFSLVAVGDNLIHGAIYKAAYDAQSGKYDFSNMYSEIKPIIQTYDLAFVNFETLAAGEKYGYSNFPNFNGPSEIIDAVVDCGFNWLSIASNHSLDYGEQALIDEYEYIHSRFDVVTTGVNIDPNNRYIVKEVNGIDVGMISYTYGLNGHQLSDGYNYLINIIDPIVIEQDLKALSEISDIQIVNMHWGNEYTFEYNQFQEEIALLCVENGADIILGQHPHVIQPLEIYRQPNGLETVVIYSLGNFISAQDQAMTMLESMLSLQIYFDHTTQKHRFENILVEPLINQIENQYTYFKVLPLNQYTDEIAKKHTLSFRGEDMSYENMVRLFNQVYPNYQINP